MEHLYIHMFGDFSLQIDDVKISDRDNRSRKIWLLLAYLICHRNRTISRTELLQLLYSGDSTSNHPENALKITLYRLRALLDRISPSMGHQLILYRKAGYTWNPSIPFTLDMEEFEKHVQDSETSDEEQALTEVLRALELYRGDFLHNLSSETWIIPLATYYHNLYIQTVLRALPLLSARGRLEEASSICSAALMVEPYHEPLHQHLMQILLTQGKQKDAVTLYEEFSQRLLQDFGIKPGKELRTFYRSITKTLSEQSLPIDVILEHLQEPVSIAGALQCEYDYFKILCHAESRAMLRSGKATHIALLSITGSHDKVLSKRSLEHAMKHLGEQIRLNLRRGDTFASCSISQYIIMLPQANYENSCMVCQRVINAFIHTHPHSPATIHFAVHPLAPDSFSL